MITYKAVYIRSYYNRKIDEFIPKFLSTNASGFSNPEEQEHILEYKIGETTKAPPDFGPLMAFQDLFFAANFLVPREPYFYKILKCRARKSGIDTVNLTSSYRDSDEIKRFWKVRKDLLNNSSYHAFFPPLGTVFCDSITPLEIVQY